MAGTSGAFEEVLAIQPPQSHHSTEVTMDLYLTGLALPSPVC